MAVTMDVAVAMTLEAKVQPRLIRHSPTNVCNTVSPLIFLGYV